MRPEPTLGPAGMVVVTGPAWALVGEVGELIEHFQWLTAEQSMTVTADDEAGARGVSDELSDALIYVVRP